MPSCCTEQSDQHRQAYTLFQGCFPCNQLSKRHTTVALLHHKGSIQAVQCIQVIARHGTGVHAINSMTEWCVENIGGGCILTCTPHIQPLQEDEDSVATLTMPSWLRRRARLLRRQDSWVGWLADWGPSGGWQGGLVGSVGWRVGCVMP